MKSDRAQGYYRVASLKLSDSRALYNNMMLLMSTDLEVMNPYSCVFATKQR